MRVTHDKNGEPFGYCEAECSQQLRVGGDARRVRKFVERHPWAAAPGTVTGAGGPGPARAPKPEPVPVTAPAAPVQPVTGAKPAPAPVTVTAPDPAKAVKKPAAGPFDWMLGAKA